MERQSIGISMYRSIERRWSSRRSVTAKKTIKTEMAYHASKRLGCMMPKS
jgi:hypothetical protein